MAPRIYFFALCFAGLLVVAIISCTRVYTLLYDSVRPSRTRRLPANSYLYQSGRLKSQSVDGHSFLRGKAWDYARSRCYTISSDWTHRLVSPEALNKLDCKQRLPKVLIIGARTSGSQTLRRVLGFHPQLATPVHETQFFDRYYSRGVQWYESQMPYTTPDQITIESTENYMYHRNASVRAIKTLGEDIRLIVILRDPVARSISDYALTRTRIRKSRLISGHYKTAFKESRTRDRLLISGKGKHGRRGSAKMSCMVDDTFEETVMKDDVEINRKNVFITDSLYVYYLRPWVKKVTPYRVLSLNAEKFARNPAETMKEVEKFLDLEPYFTPEHFRFDLNTSTYCLQEPFPICVPSETVDVPIVSEAMISTLRTQFESSCRFLFLLLKHYLELLGDVPLNYHPIE
ncbi:heparan sulfate glucosamine 3-O-sulfotransferase 1-like [Diadema setosum]|uniref:heparan sulfate glucosamine 3-O-sulfotransferase 1-like n=1 Tax=Diadema setosum TaxID=31175 RepID=UPI003B3A4A96